MAFGTVGRGSLASACCGGVCPACPAARSCGMRPRFARILRRSAPALRRSRSHSAAWSLYGVPNGALVHFVCVRASFYSAKPGSAPGSGGGSMREERASLLCTPAVPASSCTELWSIQNLNQADYPPRVYWPSHKGRRSAATSGVRAARHLFEPPETESHPPRQRRDKTTNLLRRLRPLHHVIH